MTWKGERYRPELSGHEAQSIDKILDGYHFDSSRLVEILLAVQETQPMQYISEPLASYVSNRLQVPLSRTFDVISFYSALSDTPRAKIVVQYCDSLVCRMTGHNKIEGALKKVLSLNASGRTADGRVFVEAVPCFGACDIAPALRINGVVYGHLDTETALVRALAAGGLTWDKPAKGEVGIDG